MKTETIITPVLSPLFVAFKTIGLAAIILGGLTAMPGSAQDSITVANPSFEQGYNSSWPHYGTPTGWSTSTGALGINDNSGPFWDNGGTVDTASVGFVQGNGLLGQPLSGFQVGQTYWIQFFVNARNSSDTPDLSVFEAASTAGGAALLSNQNILPSGGVAGSGNPFILMLLHGS